jgi:hypothetical protein
VGLAFDFLNSQAGKSHIHIGSTVHITNHKIILIGIIVIVIGILVGVTHNCVANDLSVADNSIVVDIWVGSNVDQALNAATNNSSILIVNAPGCAGFVAFVDNTFAHSSP